MKNLQLVGYCPESDISHYKWYPNGELIKDLLLDYAFFKIALPWGAMKIRNPLLYRKDLEEIRNLQGEFHERGYDIEIDEKPFVLRFASDTGAFPFVKRMSFSHKNMPIKIYEEAMCFRKEQSGEVVGLFRLRNFLMTDHHAFCINEEQAMEEYLKLSRLFSSLMDSLLGQYWVFGFEAVEEFYEKYKESIFKRVVKESCKPAFIKIMKEMKHYFAFKSEYQFVSPGGQNIQMSTVQWDVKNGERFKIEYVNADGKKVPVPIILHASSLGSIERTLAALLEKAEWERLKGKLPSLPLWLSPEQVRILPVSKKYLPYCEEIAKKIEEYKIRVGIDDRDITLPRKIVESRKDWIPYVVVVGEKEVKTQKLSVTVRSKSTANQTYTELLSIEELTKKIREETSVYPFRPLYISKYLSRRPIFR
ncbi:MAG: aminoacyl--tRNA ligase-related protein [Candidatus Aenigmatarchaeota archaeon]